MLLLWVRRVANRVLVWRSDGKRPLVRPDCRWDDNKMEWTDLAQDRDRLLLMRE
jgi:hypothetical protein